MLCLFLEETVVETLEAGAVASLVLGQSKGNESMREYDYGDGGFSNVY